jgi:autotransporter translocation and assembly factor TamB
VALDAAILYSADRVTVTRLVLGTQPLVESAGIDLRGLPEHAAFEARLNLGGGRLEAGGRLQESRLQARLAADGIDVSHISTLLAAHVPPFGGILSVRGQLDLPLTAVAEMTADLDVHLADATINGAPVDRVAATFTAENSSWHLTDCDVVSGANRAEIPRASIPAASALTGDVDVLVRSLEADWRLECEDIPSLLELAGMALGAPGGPIPNHRLVLSGRMEGGDIAVPYGRLEADRGRVHLKSTRVTLPAGARRLVDSPVAGQVEVDLPDLEPLGRIFGMPALGGSVRGRLKLAGTLAAFRGAAAVTARRVRYRETVFGDLSVRVVADTERLTIESAVLNRDDDRAVVRGSVHLREKRFEDLRLDVAVSDVSPFVRGLLPFWWRQWDGNPDVHGSLTGKVALSGPFERPEGTLKAQALGIRINDSLLGDADVDLNLAGDRVTLRSTVLRNGDDRVLLGGSFHSESQRLDDVRLTVDIADMAAYTQPWFPGNALVAGSVHCRLQASGALLEPDANADIRLDNLRLKHTHMESVIVHLQSSGRLLDIKTAQIDAAGGRIHLAGTIRRHPTDADFDLRLDQACLTRQETLLALEQPAVLHFNRDGAVHFNDVWLNGSVGSLRVAGRFDPDGDSDLTITVAGLGSNGWFDLIAPERIRFQGMDAQIHISGRPDSPSVTMSGVLADLGSPNAPRVFSGRFDLTYSDQTLTIRECSWNRGDKQQVRLTGNLPLDPFGPELMPPGRIALAGGIEISDAGVLDFLLPRYGITGGTVEAGLELAGTWKRPTGAVHLGVDDLNLSRDISKLPSGPYDLTVAVRIDGDRMVLDTLQAESPALHVHAAGDWSGVPAPVDLLRSETRKPTGRINLEGAVESPDLGWLARKVQGVRRVAGRLEARGTVRGPVTAPAADAIIRLSEADLSPDFDMPSLQQVNMEALVTPGAVRLERFTGLLGGAPFTLTGVLDMATASGSALDLSFEGKDLLLFRNESLRVRADTHLTLTGPLSRLELAGEIAVTDGRFTRNFSLLEGLLARGKPGTHNGLQLFSIKEPPLRDMVFNVRISAREPFQIRNNLVRGAVRPDVVLSGTGELPLLAGSVYLEPTRLYLPAGRLTLESGLVRFEANDPSRPKLDLAGTATMLGYDIRAVIDGPYNEPVVTLSSVPPLPDEDVLLLLLAGRPPKQAGLRESGKARHMNVALYLGRDLIAWLSGVESAESNESLLDRFDVEFGRRVTRKGEETIDAQFRLADKLMGERDTLYLTGERDDYDYYNLGVKIVFRFR